MRYPLFSLIVACYNQKNLVLQTLESVRASTYPEMELIVADDGSNDGTPDIAEEWLRTNRSRFSKSLLIRGEHVGISANHTRAFREASGEFVKYIGGDDILLSTALQSMASFLTAEPKAGICWSQIIPFWERAGAGRVLSKPIPSGYLGKKFGSLPAETQFRILTLWGLISAPGNFFRKDAIESIGYFGTEIKSFEDYHLWLKAAKKGLQINFLSEPTVLWRRHEGSISLHAGLQFQADIANVMDFSIMGQISNFNPIHRAVVLNRYAIVSKFRGRTDLDFGAKREFLLRRAFDPFQWKYLPGLIRLNLGLLVVRKRRSLPQARRDG